VRLGRSLGLRDFRDALLGFRYLVVIDAQVADDVRQLLGQLDLQVHFPGFLGLLELDANGSLLDLQGLGLYLKRRGCLPASHLALDLVQASVDTLEALAVVLRVLFRFQAQPALACQAFAHAFVGTTATLLSALLALAAVLGIVGASVFLAFVFQVVLGVAIVIGVAASQDRKS